VLLERCPFANEVHSCEKKHADQGLQGAYEGVDVWCLKDRDPSWNPDHVEHDGHEELLKEALRQG
jgi:hypothetical protein